MSRDVLVAGVGMIPFTKPGANEPYTQMAAKATRAALEDAGIGYELVQQAFVGYVYGDSTAGQCALYAVGMTGIPVVNVNNNCSTGSTALFLARQAVASGAECVLGPRLRADEPRRARRAVQGSPQPLRAFRRSREGIGRQARHPAGVAIFRRRRTRPHAAIRNETRDLREDSRQGEPSRRKQSDGLVPQRGDRRGCVEFAGAVARCHDAPDGVPADVRRGCGYRLLD